MAKHKQKNIHREPNGRHQRLGARVIRSDIEGTVLAQPHRRGCLDTLCADPLGSLVLKNRLKREIFYAAEAYARKVRRFYRLIGLRGYALRSVALDGLSSGTRSSPSAKPDPVAVLLAKHRLDRLERKLMACSRAGFFCLRAAAINGDTVPVEFEGETVKTLIQLAKETGFLAENQHPFSGAVTSVPDHPFLAGIQAS